MAKVIAIEYKSDNNGKESLTVQAELEENEDKDAAFESIKQWTAEKVPVVKVQEETQVSDLLTQSGTDLSTASESVYTPNLVSDLQNVLNKYSESNEKAAQATTELGESIESTTNS